jgi:flagellar motor switch protein FliM
MTEILSEDQIEQLVARARDGETLDKEAAPKARRPRRVREIDFSRPNKFTSEQQRRIERAHEGFCRTVSSQLSAELRTAIEVEVLNVAQHTWSSALAEIPQPSIYGIVDTQPLGTRMLVSIELPAILRLIVQLLGGQPVGRGGARDLTEIELALTRRIFSTLLAQLSSTWNELMGLQLDLLGLETAPQAVQLVPPSEPSLTVTMELRSEGSSSTMTLLVAHRSIEPALVSLPSGHYGELEAGGVDPATQAAVRESLADVGVELRAEVAAVELAVEDVLALRPGDIVHLGVPAAAGVTLYADAVPVHRARPGRSGKWRAVEVVQRLEAVE